MISITIRYNLVDDLIATLKGFSNRFNDLFLCSNPENESTEQLLKNIKNKIINDFIDERRNLLNEIYPDLVFPSNFWYSIYLEFEVGNFDYRIIKHYQQWIYYQLKYKKFVIPFIFGYIESFLWFYLIFILFDRGYVDYLQTETSLSQLSKSNTIIINIILILCIVYFFHILGIYLSLINIFKIITLRDLIDI